MFRLPDPFCFRPCVILGPSNTSLSSSLLRSQGPRKVRPKISQIQELSIVLNICWIGALLCNRSAAYNSGSTPRACWKQGVDSAQEILWKIPAFQISLKTAQEYRCLWLWWWLFPLFNYIILVFSNSDNCLFQTVKHNHKEREDSISLFI